jgi:hypothetical protein
VKRIALLTLALLAVTASVALAASWQTGDYKGTTAGKFKPALNKPLRTARLNFHVGAHKVSKIFVEVRLKCADGSHTSYQTQHGGTLDIGSDGHFKGGAKTVGGTGRDVIAGTVSGKTVTGYVRSYDVEDKQGNEDPHGQKCDTGRVTYTAKKQ